MTSNSIPQGNTPAALVTRTIGLSPHTNRVVYDYLLSLVNRGELDTRDMEVLVASFKDIKLRVVSSARFGLVARNFVLEQRSDVRVTDVEMLKAIATLEVLMVVKRIPDDTRRDTIRMIHDRLVLLFSR
jgi:hypothetical protein